MIILKNKQLIVKINEMGAEVNSIYDRESHYEFLWQADSNYWNRHAPILFPIVGRLKNDAFKYKEQMYEMSQHGFARDSKFDVIDTTKNSVTFLLCDSEKSRQTYPFAFELYVQYILLGNQLRVKYKVVNPSNSEELYYSLGGHPGFNVSHNGDEFDQVSFKIKPVDEITYYPLSNEGFIKTVAAKKVMFGEVTLKHQTFNNDALVYKLGEGKIIELNDYSNRVTVRMKTVNLPYIGVWSPYPKRGSFVCIEPWAGIADDEDGSDDYTKKIGINHLESNQESIHEFTMTFIKG